MYKDTILPDPRIRCMPKATEIEVVTKNVREFCHVLVIFTFSPEEASSCQSKLREI